MTSTKLYNRYLRKPLKLYWWKHQPPNKLNFGDELTPLIINEIWGRRCVWASARNCDMAGAGSIIEILQRQSGNNRLKVWGSGFIKAGPPDKSENLEYIAVRGNLSRDRIRNKNGVVLGDPGLLMPLITAKSPSKYSVGIVPHYVDQTSPLVEKFMKLHPRSIKIDVFQNPIKVANDISACELVVSSSLHGLIIADAYGVPSVRMNLSNKITGGDYKYNDYASSVQRNINTVTGSQITRSKSMDFFEKKATVCSPDIIGGLQNDLVESFPY